MIKHMIASSLVALCATMPAYAADGRARAMLNTEQITNAFWAVDPALWPLMVERLGQNKLMRAAPEQPIWLLNTDSSTIMYYQGQPTFSGKAAAQLVDDAGIRFGVQALEKASRDYSGWQKLTLGGKKFDAYCRSRRPLITCSLVTKL